MATIIVGGGLAGLACAATLEARGERAIVLEAGTEPGGRVRTTVEQGFRLDHGFQVYLTAYPEGERWFSLEQLQMRYFRAGAEIRLRGRWYTVADPWRDLTTAWKGLLAPVGSVSDKFRVARLRHEVTQGPLERLFAKPESTVREALVAQGFSPSMIESFWRPWLAGIFLDPELGTSSRFYEFVFRMMSLGRVGVPAHGMGELSRSLAGRVRDLRLGQRVRSITDSGVLLESGERLSADTVVLAVEGPEAERLLNLPAEVGSRSVTTLYFAASEPPREGGWLMLNGDGSGPVNHLAVLSEVAPEYSPRGEALIAANVLGYHGLAETELAGQVRAQLLAWFGSEVANWRLLRVDRIRHAHPARRLVPPANPNLLVCGDACSYPSIHHALESGRLTAEAITAPSGTRTHSVPPVHS